MTETSETNDASHARSIGRVPIVISLVLTAALFVVPGIVIWSMATSGPPETLDEAIAEELKGDQRRRFVRSKPLMRLREGDATVVLIERIGREPHVTQVEPVWFTRNAEGWETTWASRGVGFGPLSCASRHREGLWVCHVRVDPAARAIEVRQAPKVSVRGRAEAGLGVVVLGDPAPFLDIIVFDGAGRRIGTVEGYPSLGVAEVAPKS